MQPGNISDSGIDVTLNAMQRLQAETQLELSSEQETSAESFVKSCADEGNPFPQLKKTEKKIVPARAQIEKAAKSESLTALLPIKRMKEQADQFEKRNPELKGSTLMLLRERIKPGDTSDEILKKLAEFYPDVSLADEALEYLLETTDGEMAQTVRDAKEAFAKLHGREIAAGRNIGTQAREAAQKGLGTPTDLRDLYRNITGNPRDSTTLFQELSTQYAFEQLKKVVKFLLHSLGADLKSKGPSIDPGQLHRLLTETRSLQAVLGVYRFFNGRMGLINKMFAKEGLQLPPQLNFESLAKQFMALAGERYPSGDKVLQTAVRLGIEKWLMAKIIVLSQLRDAIREVAVNQIYRSIQHRDELYLAILEALEDLEDELEELLDEQERQGGGQRDDEEDEDEANDQVK